MGDPFISIVTPSYDQADFIEDNILSVKTQAQKVDNEVEHIVIDGGSNDGTVKLLQEHENDYNLRWISEKDRGQSHAVNKGIQMARGDWIGWQNSDDYYLQNSFALVQNVIKNSNDVSVIYGDLLIVDEEGNEISRQFMTHPSKFIQRNWSLFASNQSTFFKKDVFERVGYLKEEFNYAMDAELFWRILESDLELVHIPEYLGAFRVQKDAKTFGDVSKSQREELEVIYDYPVYEKVLPNRVLELLAMSVKALYLLYSRRWKAFEYNIRNVTS